MKKIYFKGYYGFKNLGDDIFCVTADWICNHLWKESFPIFIGDSIPNISNNAKKIETKNRFYKKIWEIYICLKADHIIYFGGSVLSKMSGYKDLKFYLNKFSIFNKKLGTIGTSIGPFRNTNDYDSIRDFLAKFNFIAVRDYSSLSTVGKMNIDNSTSFSFDSAIIIKDVFPSLNNKEIKSNTNKIKLAVSLCHYERYKGMDLSIEKEREAGVLDFIHELIESDNNIEEIVFFEFNGDENLGDLGLINEFNDSLKQKVKTKIVNYSSDTESFCAELNKCDFLVGIRLHSGILAYSMNIPFFLIEYHPKCTEFLNTINNNYRFEINNNGANIIKYNQIMKKKYLPEIVEPKYFRDIFIEQVLKIGNNLK